MVAYKIGCTTVDSGSPPVRYKLTNHKTNSGDVTLMSFNDDKLIPLALCDEVLHEHSAITSKGIIRRIVRLLSAYKKNVHGMIRFSTLRDAGAGKITDFGYYRDIRVNDTIVFAVAAEFDGLIHLGWILPGQGIIYRKHRAIEIAKKINRVSTGDLYG